MTELKPTGHALLGASSAHRWMTCTPSARLEERFMDETSEYAEEGTIAHEKAARLLSEKLGYPCKDLLTYDNEEQRQSVELYVGICLEKAHEAYLRSPDYIHQIESRVNFSKYVPEGFGTADFLLVADGVLEVCDLKYGKGVSVSAHRNPQLMLYALGAVDELDHLYDIHTVKVTIIQPRIDNVSSFSISKEELLQWANEEVIPQAVLAFKGEGPLTPGEHCQFCRARYNCPARKQALDKVVQVAQTLPSYDLITDEQIAQILPNLDHAENFIKNLKKYSLDRALQGHQWPGYKLVEGRSTRMWTNDLDAVQVLKRTGVSESALFTRTVLSVSQMEKALGKKVVAEAVADLITKKPGAPTLVPIDDPRPVMQPQLTIEEVQDDFKED